MQPLLQAHLYLGARDDVGLMPVCPCYKMLQREPEAHDLCAGTRLKGLQCYRKVGLAKRTMQILKDGSNPASIWLDRAISIYPDPSLMATCNKELLSGCLLVKELDWEGVNNVPRSCGPEVEAVQAFPTFSHLHARGLEPLNGTPSDING